MHNENLDGMGWREVFKCLKTNMYICTHTIPYPKVPSKNNKRKTKTKTKNKDKNKNKDKDKDKTKTKNKGLL